MLRIGVISDTHIPTRAKELPAVVTETFKGVEHIIHAGDIMSMGVIDILEKLAPVTAVAGNLDPAELYDKFGDKRIITIGNFHFGVFHGHGDRGRTIDRAVKQFQEDPVDCIIFGHSHIPYCEFHKDILLFNPGSPTDKRRNKYYSFGIIEIEEYLGPELVYFDDKGEIKQDLQ